MILLAVRNNSSILITFQAFGCLVDGDESRCFITQVRRFWRRGHLTNL